jgi:hypothetical protein
MTAATVADPVAPTPERKTRDLGRARTDLDESAATIRANSRFAESNGKPQVPQTLNVSEFSCLFGQNAIAQRYLHQPVSLDKRAEIITEAERTVSSGSDVSPHDALSEARVLFAQRNTK